MQAGEGRKRISALLGRATTLAPTLAAGALLGVAALRLGGAFGDASSLLALCLSALAGLVAADLASGVVHWLCDTFGDERTPVIGPLVIAPFREHHVDPQILARKSFADAAASNAWLALAVLLPWLWLAPPPQELAEVFVGGFVVTLGTAVYLTNTFHQWAHQSAPPRAALWLQRLRLAIPPQHHALHHASGDGAYCVTTGWCNPTLDRWSVFPRLERACAKLRGERLGSRSHG